MRRLTIPAASKEYLRVEVGAFQDPTAATVEFALPALGATPTTWVEGSWDGPAERSGEVYTATARVLIGSGTSLANAAGTYQAYVRVNAAPEAVVREFAQIAVT